MCFEYILVRNRSLPEGAKVTNNGPDARQYEE